jgi:hypothetical protein
VRLLRQCFLDETADVRQAGVGSAGAARLDRRRVRIQANDARALVRLHADAPLKTNKNKIENDFCDQNHFLAFCFHSGAPQTPKKIRAVVGKRARWGGTGVARAFLTLCLAIADNLACNCRSTCIGGMVMRAAMLMALTAHVQGNAPPRTSREMCFIRFLLVCERVVISSLELVGFCRATADLRDLV